MQVLIENVFKIIINKFKTIKQLNKTHKNTQPQQNNEQYNSIHLKERYVPASSRAMQGAQATLLIEFSAAAAEH